jgi:uncharacterized protein
MKFEWDPDKDRVNNKKHKVTFLEASYIFADQYMLTLFDDEHSETEDRWITLGQLPTGKILVVSHTYRKMRGKESVRIISARKATAREQKQYFERRAK